MRRLLAIATSVAILLILFVPTAFAAEPTTTSGSVVLSVNGTVDIPSGQHVDTVIVVDGSARISGDADTIVVARGTATLSDATVGTLVVVDGSADLQGGTVVRGDVRTLHGAVTQQPGAVVQGSVRALDTDLAALALLMIPVLIVFMVGIAIAGILAALAVAAFGARQVREVEALISERPGHVLVAGIIGSVALPVLAFMLIMTVVGAPIGLALLFMVLPAIAFLGWLVAAIWIGDWIVTAMRGSREPGRPYRAAILGVIALAVLGVVPFVGTIATLFGFGALLLAAWHVLRPEAPGLGTASSMQPSPTAG